ncbi:MAG: SpoIIE family protein phosphatase [Bacteroidales bacterium]|nr:SpoIIE family protein phosphatase [Bacteroidales bacterium]
MNNRSFSSRLSWRIIGIVSVVFFVSFIAIGLASRYALAHRADISVPLLLGANLVLVGVPALILLYFLCRREIRRMTRPITELSVSALNMGKGNFKARLPDISSQDEMLRLRNSFVYMQNSISDYIGQLKTTRSDNERMESELNVARTIQMGMLNTHFPPQLHALLTPAKEVGGDLYDFILKDNVLHFAVGDVSGKGVPASLVMSITRAMLHFVATLDLPLNESVSRINNSVADANSNDMFVTLFVARINLKTMRMDYCNAGHNPPVVIPPDGAPRFLPVKSNLAAGLLEQFPYESEAVDLVPGTRLIVYTDGVTEAENDSLELYGEDRMLANIGLLEADMDEKAVVQHIYRSVKAFAAGRPQSDDITIMSVKI